MPDGFAATAIKYETTVEPVSDGDDFLPKATVIADLLDKALKIAFQPPKNPVSGYRSADASMAGTRIGVRYPCDKEVICLSRRDGYEYLHWLHTGATGTYEQFRKGTQPVMLAKNTDNPLDRLRTENIKFRRAFERIRAIGYAASLKYGDDRPRDQMATIAGEALLS